MKTIANNDKSPDIAAEKWFNETLNDDERAELEKGISAIIYRGCMLAAQRSYDTIVAQKTEERRKEVLEIYHKTKQVYTEKEIIKLVSNGDSSKIVVDAHRSLVDDALIQKEKIGGINYFWSFPANYRNVCQQHERTLRTIEELRKKTTLKSAKLTKIKQERSQKSIRLAELKKERKILREEIDSFNNKENNDPQQELKVLNQQLELVKQGANRWTDNILNCKSYLVKQRGMCKKEVMKILGITNTFDYPEDKIPR